MPPAAGRWSLEFFEEIKARLEKDLDGHGSLPIPRDDLVAEALLRLFLANEERTVRAPVAYARMILLNLVRDHVRQLDRARRALDALARSADRNGRNGRAGEIEDAELVRRLIESAGLSRIQQLVLERLYFDDLTICELARQLGKNPGTIHQHHERALEKLSRCAARMGIVR